MNFSLAVLLCVNLSPDVRIIRNDVDEGKRNANDKKRKDYQNDTSEDKGIMTGQNIDIQALLIQACKFFTILHVFEKKIKTAHNKIWII